jgi:hypothetical protein
MRNHGKYSTVPPRPNAPHTGVYSRRASQHQMGKWTDIHKTLAGYILPGVTLHSPFINRRIQILYPWTGATDTTVAGITNKYYKSKGRSPKYNDRGAEMLSQHVTESQSPAVKQNK